jgi:hypothetical protein
MLLLSPPLVGSSETLTTGNPSSRIHEFMTEPTSFRLDELRNFHRSSVVALP